MNFKLWMAVILLLLVAVFSVQNATTISVHFLLWQFAMSQALVIILAAVCGGLAGLVAGAVARRRKPGNDLPRA
jgi:uncharacterized integral membrane protein